MTRRLDIGGERLPVGAIGWLVDRHHVTASALTVGRDIWRRSYMYPLDVRRGMARVAIRRHEANRRLYGRVVSGRL